MIEFTTKYGKIRVNPQFVACLYQGNGRDDTCIVMASEYISYAVDMPIEEVEKKLAAEYTPIGYLSEVIETLTNVIRKR